MVATAADGRAPPIGPALIFRHHAQAGQISTRPIGGIVLLIVASDQEAARGPPDRIDLLLVTRS